MTTNILSLSVRRSHLFILRYHPPLIDILLLNCSVLPPRIMRRVAALKELQNQSTEIDVEYKRERILLESKYRLLKLPLLSSRDKIVSGEVDCPKLATDENPGESSSSLQSSTLASSHAIHLLTWRYEYFVSSSSFLSHELDN